MEEIKKDFEEKKKELKDWLYGTVYKGYDLEELAETVQQDVDDFFTEEWFNSVINLAVSKERERRDAQIIEFINSGEPAPWNDTGWSVELSDVEKFIKNTK